MRGGRGGDGVAVKVEGEVQLQLQLELQPQLPGFTHAAPSSSKRVHPPRRGTNRGLGKRITADHSTSVGKRPTEKFSQAVQALLSPAKPPFVCVLWYARTSLNLVSPLQLPAVCRGCRPLPRLSAARFAFREVEVVEVGILSRLLCITVGLSVQAPSANHTICHSVCLSVSPELLLPDAGTPRGPFAPRDARLPPPPSHSFPVIGPESR